MNVQNQIKNYRKKNGYSQDDLAERVFVSRQTISNWETGKSYPDIHSLLLLSTIFDISLDELIKGDVENMKEVIKDSERAIMRKWSYIYTFLFIVMIVSLAPLYHYLKLAGVIAWVIIATIAILSAFKVDKLKKANDIQTYQEIVAFMDGKKVDELRTNRKPSHQILCKIFWAIISGGFAFFVVYWMMSVLVG